MKVLYLLLLAFCVYACGKQHQLMPVISSSDYKKGISFLNHQNDSAFYYLNRFATNAKDSVEIATAYNLMATIQSDEGDYYGGQESLLTSLKYLDERKERDYYSLSSDYNELGNNSLNLKDYKAAIDYYDKTLQFLKDDNYKVIILNNKAHAYQKMKQYGKAITIYESILNKSKESGREYARISTNLSITRWLQDSNYRAAPDLLMALEIRQREKDDRGLNSSYAHLSDYYSHSRPDSALLYAEKMYAIAQQLNSPDDQMEALEKLIKLGPSKTTKDYFIRYQHLNDSTQTVRNAAKNQFALIRYEAEKNKADNLRLQKENSEKQVEIILLWVIVVGSASLFTATFVFLNNRNKRRKLEYQNALRENQLKTSKKVHDVVANGLYQVMMEIEHQETIEKEPLLDKIEVLYERSRDISYEQPQNTQLDFQEVIAGMLTAYASQDTKVLVVGNDKALWTNINNQVKIELEQVLKELMINMKKHSSARNVVVRLDRIGDELQINYTDDGVGLPETFRYGNGLTSTGNRIQGIGGRIIFDKNAVKGLTIRIHLPIA